MASKSSRKASGRRARPHAPARAASLTGTLSPKVRARLLYVQSELSIAEVAEHPLMRGTHRRTLERWCADDGWVQRRHEANERWHALFDEKLTHDMLAAQQAVLKNITLLHEHAVTAVTMGALQPKSWEGAAMAVVRTAQILTDARKAMFEAQQGLPPSQKTDTQQVPAHVLPKFTPDEARFLAHQMIKLRQGDPAAVAEANTPFPAPDDQVTGAVDEEEEGVEGT